eukprot:TRINITY_DN2628_c0_g1_i3.p1 TRINITY_DN2628_c0_g1~~TRINITY_DN2628_c0_g1_i3.p1  ORF type:complete len:197 (+),score=31.22 TRINITY_DN2628_c0_g1_i3:150-740(+)
MCIRDRFDTIIQETKHCAQHYGLQLGQVGLHTLGLQQAVQTAVSECLLPRLAPQLCQHQWDLDASVFADVDKPLFEHSVEWNSDHALQMKPEHDIGRSLPAHLDDSDFTINLCLGGNFNGGCVNFELPGTEPLQCVPKPAVGLFHPGSVRHSVDGSHGERFNLLLFLKQRHAHDCSGLGQEIPGAQEHVDLCLCID